MVVMSCTKSLKFKKCNVKVTTACQVCNITSYISGIDRLRQIAEMSKKSTKQVSHFSNLLTSTSCLSGLGLR